MIDLHTFGIILIGFIGFLEATKAMFCEFRNIELRREISDLKNELEAMKGKSE